MVSNFAYYLPAILMPGLIFVLMANRRKHLGCVSVVFFSINLSAVVDFIYSIALALYFQNYYVGEPFDVYPSLTFSYWYWNVLIFFVAPVNIFCSVVFLINKFSTPSKPPTH